MTQLTTLSAATAAGADATEASAPWPRPAYAWAVVAILLLVSICSYLDRQIISLVVEDIKHDLGLSDFQIGLLQGPPFGLFYALMAMPIAVFADRYHRRNLILGGLGLWSVATVACGLASTFAQLFVARACVAVGEATLNPCAFSIVSDYFDRQRRSLALSIYSIGTVAGVGLAMIVGGVVLSLGRQLQGQVALPIIGPLEPWQFAFVVIGAPGILLGALLFVVREPLRRGMLVHPAAGAGDLVAFCRFIARNGQAFFALFGSFTILALMSYANFAWVPTFFIRTFGWPAPQAGVVYGTLAAVVGTSGALFGGVMANSLSRRGYSDAPYRTIFLCTFPLAPCAVLAFVVAPTGAWAAGFYALWQFFAATPSGLGAAAMMSLAPNEMRAKTAALYFFCLNLFGVTLGPTAVGLLTTHVFRDDLMLRYSLTVISCVGTPLALLLIGWGMKPYRASLAAIDADRA
jgi:MFS family permease